MRADNILRRGLINRLFSDRFKWIKISIALIVVVMAGNYYHQNVASVLNSRKYLENLFKNQGPFEICLYGVKIRKTDKLHYFGFFVNKATNLIELKNLPQFVKINPKKTYEMKGKMIDRSFIEVKESTKRNPNKFDIIGKTIDGKRIEAKELKTKYPVIHEIASHAFADAKRKGKTFSCGAIMEVEAIRATYPRFLKISISGLTAIIVCLLFFMHFKYSHIGFVYRSNR